MIENRQLRLFIVAAQHMNITRAAKALFITQPALTRNIQQIEEKLGVALFHRAHKRISLTEAGESFLAEAQLLLQQLDNSIVAAQKAARGELGRLVIGYTPSAGLVAVPKLVSVFRKRYPGPMIVLHELNSAGLEAALRKGSIDVALLYGTYADEEHAVHLLESDRFMVALPENHRLAKRTRVNLLDLAEDNFILPSHATGGATTEDILEECRLAGFLPQSGHEIATATVQTTLGLVSAGLGVTLIPNGLRPFSRQGVIYRPLSKTSVTLHLNMLWRPQNISAVLRNFLNTVGKLALTEKPGKHVR